MKGICEFLTNALQFIDAPGGRDSLLGLIDASADYLAAYGHTFNCLEIPLIAYNHTITSKAT